MKSDGLANFLLGLGVGIGLGVLFAPRSGEETRSYIKNKADEGADYLKRQTEDLRADLKAKADHLADKSRDVLNRQRDNLSEAIDAGKQAYREKIDSMSAKPV
jgi:gas vesicle protein